LPAIDAVLISHNHYDHLGSGTVRRLAQMDALRQARWISPLGVAAILASLGVDPRRCTELNWTEYTEVGSLTVTALPARHFSGRGLFDRFETLWASFALIGMKHRVYYGADSGEWFGFRDIGERFGPFDLTMLEIGASDPLWADIHMGPDGAVRSFRAMGGYGLLMLVGRGMPRKGRERRCEPQPTLAEGQPPDAPYSQSSCECCSQAQGEHLRDRVPPSRSTPGT
jgi:L-ascorbate metabolism protein UlaG (beta-lactamase superfamily)